MRPLRVIGFSVLYFLLFSGFFAYNTVRVLAVAQPDELIWYLSECPSERLIAILFAWIIRNPIMILSFLGMSIQALILGFLTDWGIQTLRRHMRPFVGG